MPEMLTAIAAKTFSRKVQAAEAVLAENLYYYFNKGEALRYLQNLAGNCIEQMLNPHNIGPNALANALNAESKLAVYNKAQGPSVASLSYLLKHKPILTASDVSDIIRLFGEFVEQGGVGNDAYRTGPGEKDDWGKDHKLSDSIKQAYRPPVPGASGKYPERAGRVWGEIKDSGDKVMTDPSHPDLGYRDRRGAGWPVEAHIDRRPDKTAFSGMGGKGPNAEKSKRAKNASNILKIDRVFGLVVGADISGTTADTVYALEHQGWAELTSIYYMLPLATIVYNNHHAMLEVALALTLNGVIDYNIGFYSSLMPTGAKTPSELQEVPGILAQAENQFKDQHLVTFYVQSSARTWALAGGFLLTDAEAKGSVGTASVNAKEWLRRAPHLPDYPTRGMIQSFFLSKLYHQRLDGLAA